jgi:hypothetical protein
MKVELISGRAEPWRGETPKRVTGSRQSKPLATATYFRVEQSLESAVRLVGFTLWFLCILFHFPQIFGLAIGS